jgi:hypothetical protein
VAARVGDALGAAQASRWPGASSGRPKAQPGTVRCAVLASMRQVSGLVISAAASRDAASGRHRKATSAALSRRARSALSLRCRRDAQHLHVGALRQILVDAQPGGALLAIDEDLECHRSPQPQCRCNAARIRE